MSLLPACAGPSAAELKARWQRALRSAHQARCGCEAKVAKRKTDLRACVKAQPERGPEYACLAEALDQMTDGQRRKLSRCLVDNLRATRECYRRCGYRTVLSPCPAASRRDFRARCWRRIPPLLRDTVEACVQREQRALVAQKQATRPVVIPTSYYGDRFFATPVTREGVTLQLFTDTGGGLFLFDDVVELLGLKRELVRGGKAAVVQLPPFRKGQAIPPPLVTKGRLLVAPASRRKLWMKRWSGMLGQAWFAGRVWVFDYPRRQLIWRRDGKLPAGRRVNLGFATRKSDGKRGANFPRITVMIDGERVEMLFDTGATVALTPDAVAARGPGAPAVRATSFIVASRFDRWRKRHAKWEVIERAEQGTGEPLIRVPEVMVAGYKVGPVWFTRRADKNFHQFMSRVMDRRIDGALGGNALTNFRITVDYPRAVAVFEKP